MELTPEKLPVFYVLDNAGGEIAKYPRKDFADAHALQIKGAFVDERAEPHPLSWHEEPKAVA